MASHKDSTLIVFAGGGTGGHLFPALAMVEHLREHHHQVGCEFLCTERAIDERVLRNWNVPFTVQPVRPLPRTIGGVVGFYRGWRGAVGLCSRRFRRERPDVVVGTGGFGSGPAVKAAHRLGILTAMLNPDVKPGRANRYLARRVDEIYVQWADTIAQLPRRAAVEVTGCPVRRQFLEPGGGHDYEQFGLREGLRTLLVTGASSGARSINDAFVLLAREMSQIVGWQVIHISGVGQEPRLREAYATADLPAAVLPFTDAMAAALRCADLAVARSGAVTLAELSATHTPAILMPYPHHADLHQQANAEVLTRRGAAVIVQDGSDPQLNADRLRESLLPLMRRPMDIAAMTRRAADCAPANATVAACSHLLRLAGATVA